MEVNLNLPPYFQIIKKADFNQCKNFQKKPNNKKSKVKQFFNRDLTQDKFNKINPMNSSFISSSGSRTPNAQRQYSPQKEQWALINQYKALQYERLKQKQRLLAQQKKLKFKSQLDRQLSSKNDVNIQEKQADRKYYDFITRQANSLKEKQQREKYQKMIRRKQAEQENARLLQMNRNSRIKDYDSGYHLQIGHKSEQQRRRNSESMKRAVLDTLDEQIKQKQQEKEYQLSKQRQKQIKNLQYQYNYFDKRSDLHKNFGQNQKVYQYYQELQKQKRFNELELQHKLVEKAAIEKRMMQDQRIKNQQMKKYRIKQEVKETLDQQVKAHNYKKFEESKINPEQYSYGIISNVFRERGASYDKGKYVEELRMQAEEQRRKKKMQNYMSEQEYRLNMNQLNKVVNGEYAHSGYVDRSMGTIGDNKHLRLTDIRDRIGDRDADVVKHRLDALRRNQNASQMLQRTDKSL